MKKFDLTTVYNEKRPLSWSGISSFQWNKRQWYEKYVLKILPEVTPELRFGSMVDKKIQDDPKYLPNVIRYSVLQHEMRAMWNGIPLLGFADAHEPSIPAIRDYKTGRKPWDKKRADETGQLTMYLFMEYLKNRKLKPEAYELYIDWLPTHIKDGEIAFIEPNHKILVPKTFKTKRTMSQILTFGKLIEDTWAEMEAYASRDHGAPHVKVAKPLSKFLK